MDKFESRILGKLDIKKNITKLEFDKLYDNYRVKKEELNDYELPVIKLDDRFFQLYYTKTDGISSKYPEEVEFRQKQIAVDAYSKPIYYTWYEPKKEEKILLEETT
jgi:hypothetical protein